MRQRSRSSSRIAPTVRGRGVACTWRATALAIGIALGLHGSAALAADDASKVPADPPPHPVVDPHYGDVLFYFYQGLYFPAITKLEVSQHFQRLPRQADEAEILRGGLLLSYGLHEQAAEVFEALLARGAPPSVRDRAWYFLAKVRYQRGLMPEASNALARIEHRWRRRSRTTAGCCRPT